MKKYICLLTAAVTLLVTPVFGAELDTKILVGTFVFEGKKVNEEKAIEIGTLLSDDKEIQRILVRQFKDANTWALDLEVKHNGTKESFRNAVANIEKTIEEKFGKDVIKSKYVASSVTWIKK